MKQIIGWALIVAGAISALRGIGLFIEEEGNGAWYLIFGTLSIVGGVLLKKVPKSSDDDYSPTQETE